MKRDEKEFDGLPEELIRELRSSDESTPMITARVDREVMKMAREQFALRRPAWRRPAWVAVAAAVVLAVLVVDFQSERQADISDVLIMARQTQGEPGAQERIDALAYQLVSLGSSGDSQ